MRIELGCFSDAYYAVVMTIIVAIVLLVHLMNVHFVPGASSQTRMALAATAVIIRSHRVHCV